MSTATHRDGFLRNVECLGQVLFAPLAQVGRLAEDAPHKGALLVREEGARPLAIAQTLQGSHFPGG